MSMIRKVAAGAAVAMAGAGVLMAAEAGAAAGCRVTYTVTNQWQGGFGAAVDVRNLGDPVNGWTLTFAFPSGQTITQLWNGTHTQTGAQVTVRDAGYNAAIPTNGSVSFGFNGGGAPGTPASFTLNGTACTGAVQPTTAPTSRPVTTPPVTTPPVTTPPVTTPPVTTPPVTSPPGQNGRQMERLDRGLISVRSGNGNLVSWRWLAADPAAVTFNVYRGTTRVNGSPVTSTNYLDAGAPTGASYTVRAVVGGAEQAASPASLPFTDGYLSVPIRSPGSAYAANDAGVGDLDGDGRLDLVLKWEPNNARDNSQTGATDPVYVDAYRLDGTRLWRVDLGRNIRAGAHYTQFQVYDYDGDGAAEVAMKTADGTVSGTGQVIGNAGADHRNSGGYVLSGPEFLTVFHGRTGAAAATVAYEPARGAVSSWGDTYGNRVDRFLAGTAYLDGRRPSIIMARGYYARSAVAAYDFRGGALTRRWLFDTGAPGNGAYAGQGNHQLSVADVDADGRDEIVYGSMALDDNGARLWSNGNGHGDALHVGDLDPSRAGLEVFKVSEDASRPSSWFADARTGQVRWSTPAGGDNGRGVSADIWAGSAGAESWSATVDGVRNPGGTVVAGRKPSSINFLAWWDGDPTRELLDGTRIDKYSPSGETRLLSASGVHSNNGTKSTPSLSGDLFGDWREEVVWPTSDNTALRIYATPVPTDRRITTLLQDPMYRVALAWQNTAYNQPPHPSFFIGAGMAEPPRPANIYQP